MDVPASHMMEAIASDAVMEETYAWLCERGKNYASDSDGGTSALGGRSRCRGYSEPVSTRYTKDPHH